MTQTQEVDPLASYDTVPSVSFDPGRGGVPENEWLSLTVKDYIKLVQAKDDDGKPMFYEDSGKPVNKAVLAVTMPDGEERALWAKVIRKHDTALFAQLVAAQKELQKETGNPDRRLGPGDEIAVSWYWNTALPKKLGNHPKAYKVKVKAGTAPAPKSDPLGDSGDPWSSTPPAAPNSEPPF